MPGETLHSAETLKKYGQDHVIQYWGILTPQERESLLLQLATINIKETNEFYDKCMTNNNEERKTLPSKMQPVPKERYFCASDMSEEQLQRNWDIGLEAIANGHVGVLLLAGGQGTRLGVNYPKGMYDVGLPSTKVLYQLQAERIIRIQQLAAEKFPDKAGKIMWYIMTSEATDELTEAYFKSHGYFGLDPNQILFFEQGLLPCYDFDRKIIMETRSRLAMAPDGNGGLYKALWRNNILDHFDQHNIRYLHVYCVDNILVRMADPYFLGCCIANNADCGNKVVEKTNPTEPVGVVCWADDTAFVVEYSELPQEMAQRKDDDGRLTFRAGNIANHFFTSAFLRSVCQDYENRLVHHVAKKKIPYYGTKDGGVEAGTIQPKAPNGIKMEKFVFDVFQFAENFYVYEVPRSSEFSPLKNASGVDSPETCRHDLFALHQKWIENGGGVVIIPERSSNEGVEVSPLLSYVGEGLEPHVAGKELVVPICLKADIEKGDDESDISNEENDLGRGDHAPNSEIAEKEILDTPTKDKTLPLESGEPLAEAVSEE